MPAARSALPRLRTALPVTVVALGAVLAPTPASAAEIPDAVSGIVVANESGTTPLARYDDLLVTADWAVPDGSAPGDTFGLTLPPELEGLTAGFPLESADGAVFGDCVVSAADVTCTLSDAVVARPLDVGGSLFFSARFTDAVDEGTTVPLVFGTGTRTETVPVEVAERVGYAGSGFSKAGSPQPDGGVRWFVEFPHGPDGLERTLTDVVIVDTLDPSLAYADGAAGVRLVIGDGLNAGGTAPLYTDEVDRDLYSVTVDGQVATVTVPELTAGAFYRLVVDTVPVAGATPPFTNSATLVAAELPEALATEAAVAYAAGGNASGVTATAVPAPAGPPAAGGAGESELAATGAAGADGAAASAGALLLLVGGALVVASRRPGRRAATR